MTSFYLGINKLGTLPKGDSSVERSRRNRGEWTAYDVLATPTVTTDRHERGSREFIPYSLTQAATGVNVGHRFFLHSRDVIRNL